MAAYEEFTGKRPYVVFRSSNGEDGGNQEKFQECCDGL